MIEYLDEELLEAKRNLEYEKHKTLETGIYAGEELITFTQKSLPGTNILLMIPDQFIVMPDSVKNIKYPSKDAPSFIMTSLDSKVNLCFNLLPVSLMDEELDAMSRQFQTALQNINPSIIVKNQTSAKTIQGNEMSWFEHKGYHLDGQSFNRIYLIRLRKNVLHGTFSCDIKDKNNWLDIVNQLFLAVVEEL